MILPSVFYKDPAMCVDEIRKLRKLDQRRAELHRLHKGRRIRALVKRAMNGGGR